MANRESFTHFITRINEIIADSNLMVTSDPNAYFYGQILAARGEEALVEVMGPHHQEGDQTVLVLLIREDRPVEGAVRINFEDGLPRECAVVYNV